jgi:hypothetical protein
MRVGRRQLRSRPQRVIKQFHNLFIAHPTHRRANLKVSGWNIWFLILNVGSIALPSNDHLVQAHDILFFPSHMMRPKKGELPEKVNLGQRPVCTSRLNRLIYLARPPINYPAHAHTAAS